MIKESIYVAINHNDEIQWVIGSSSKTRYFRTDKYLKKAVDYHNKLHPEDIWKVRKCLIVEDIPETDRRTRQDYMDYFSHMEYEEIHDGPLGGQAWDEIDWWLHYAVDVDKVFTENELENAFPNLFRWEEQ